MHLNIDVDHFQSTLVSHLSLVCPLALFMLVFWASRKTLNNFFLKKSGFLVPLRAKVLPSWKEDDMNFPGRKCNTLYAFISLFLTHYFSSYFCLYLWWQVSPMKVKGKEVPSFESKGRYFTVAPMSWEKFLTKKQNMLFKIIFIKELV